MTDAKDNRRGRRGMLKTLWTTKRTNQGITREARTLKNII